jgi:hypothetical protein
VASRGNGRAGGTTKTVKPKFVPPYTVGLVWGDVKVGDQVKVRGELGFFTFRGVHIKDDVVIAIHCHGGPGGNVTNRFFYPSRVTKVKAKRTRKPKAAPKSEDDV